MSSCVDKVEEYRVYLLGLGYIVDSRFLYPDSMLFNLPAIGSHNGYAIRLVWASGDINIYDGGEPIWDISMGKIAFTHDNLIISHADSMDTVEIMGILSEKTMNLINSCRELRKSMRFNRIGEI